MGQGFKLYYYKSSTMQFPQGYIDLEKVSLIIYTVHYLGNMLLEVLVDLNNVHIICHRYKSVSPEAAPGFSGRGTLGGQGGFQGGPHCTTVLF